MRVGSRYSYEMIQPQIVLLTSLGVIILMWGIGLVAPPVADQIQVALGIIMIALIFISFLTGFILCNGREGRTSADTSAA